MHKVQREITPKVSKAELPFLHSARHLMLIDICIKFHEYSLSGFQVIERTRFVTDRQTDRQTDRRTDGQTDRQTDARGKTICLPTLKGGDIINLNILKALETHHFAFTDCIFHLADLRMFFYHFLSYTMDHDLP